MRPVGWKALEQWGDGAVRSEPFTGGAGVNELWSVRVDGHVAVGRLGQRSNADLAWETDLLRHLHREGMPVPVPIPTTDGRYFVGGLVFQHRLAWHLVNPGDSFGWRTAQTEARYPRWVAGL